MQDATSLSLIASPTDLTAAKADTGPSTGPFRNTLAEFIHKRTYARWLQEEGRRETWDETVDRYVDFIVAERPAIPRHVADAVRKAIRAQAVMPSMRALWAAGPAARRDNTCLYNCSFVPLDSLVAFSELLYILMQGTGVGFSVERQFVNKLPVVAPISGKVVDHVIPDSTTGWSDALRIGLEHWFNGNRVDFDYDGIRPAGAILETKGGRASGPDPLRRLMEFAEETILGGRLAGVDPQSVSVFLDAGSEILGQVVWAGEPVYRATVLLQDTDGNELSRQRTYRSGRFEFEIPEGDWEVILAPSNFDTGASGRKLKPIEAHDIGCMIGEIVMVGGVRRAALISISDVDDEEMRHAKDWSRGSFPDLRYMANNSAYYAERPTEDQFWAEWNALRASMSGERGLSIDSWHRRAGRPKGKVRTNPCGEIGLRFEHSNDPWTGEGGHGQFCNLSAAVMRSDDTVETFSEKVRLATWLGAIQSTFTHFPYLRPGWAKVCEEDRLLGVDITGQCDNPALSTNDAAMKAFNQVALDTAAAASAVLGINMPVAITCGKPSGNSSQLLDCASGFHPRYSRYYLRRVRIASTDPLFQLARDEGLKVYQEVKFRDLPPEECPTWVVEFPIMAPPGSVLRDDETAIQQLERYLQIMNTWCSERGHNQSATIYVRDNEWDEVGNWVFDHFDEITGISFLPYDGGKYELAPYEEITEAEYEAAIAVMPDVDFSKLSAYEQEDRGQGSVELACSGGSCEIDYDTLIASMPEAEQEAVRAMLSEAAEAEAK